MHGDRTFPAGGCGSVLNRAACIPPCVIDSRRKPRDVRAQCGAFYFKDRQIVGHGELSSHTSSSSRECRKMALLALLETTALARVRWSK